MYIACRPLELNHGKRVASGQPVPDVESWSEVALRANINLGYIQWVADVTVPEPTPVETVAKVIEEALKPAHKCEDCSKEFLNSKSLMGHRSRTHRKK